LRGRVALAKKDIAGARHSYEQALAADAAYFPAAASLAQLDLADRKPDAARQRFEGVIAKDPNNAQALLALAALKAQSSTAAEGAAKEAASREVTALINKAIAAQPAATAPRLALIRYYIGIHEGNKAVTAAQGALAAMPTRPEILDAAGRAYQSAGDNFQALTQYRRLATLQRSSPQPYLRMAEVQWAAKNKDDAIDSLRKALEIQPDLIDAQRALIAAYLDGGRMPDALRVAREAQKQRPKQSSGYLFEGDIYASQKKWNEAVTAYRTGIAQAGSTDLAVRLHTALMAGGGASDAERFGATWLKDHPGDSSFRMHIAQAAIAAKDYRTATQHYRKLLDTQPNSVVLLNNLAWAEGQLNDPKAIEHAEKANTLAPNQPAVMDTLAVLLMQKGDTTRAVDLLQKASAAAPQAAAIRLNFAKALIKAGQKDAARKELDELAKLGDKFAAQNEVAQLKQGL
jgi:putative PEP-CTERM system TPR-repeat lipoprotein